MQDTVCVTAQVFKNAVIISSHNLLFNNLASGKLIDLEVCREAVQTDIKIIDRKAHKV